MNYSAHQHPKVGDRVIDKTGKSGAITEIYTSRNGREAVAVKWDDGGAAKSLSLASQFTLLTRATVENVVGKIPRPRLAEMLQRRMSAKHDNTDGDSRTR